MLTVVSGKILVVDDDPNWGLVVKKLLTNLSEVVTVESGSAALDIINKQSFDIVMVDIVLPDILGVELIPQIRAHNRRIALYVVSGHTDNYSAANCLQLGAERYIDKSVEPSALRTMVKHTLKQQSLLNSLRAEQERYVRLVANAPIGVFTLDPDTMQFTFVNRFLLDLMGYEKEDVITHRPDEFVVPEHVKLVKSKLHQHTKDTTTAKGQTTICRCLKKDGSTVGLQVETHVIEEGGDRFLEGTARDVTTEERISRLHRTVIELGQSILSSSDIQRIIQSVVDAIVEQSGFQRAAASLYDLSIIVPDVRGEDRYLKWSGLTRSEIDLPIISSKEALGVISVESACADAFGLQDREILTSLANQLSVAIKNLKHRTFLFQIHDLAHMLVGATSVEELVSSTLDFIGEQFSMQQNIILLREGEGLTVRGLRNPGGKSDIRRGSYINPDQGIVGWVLEHGIYALVNDIKKDKRYVNGFHGTRSELAVPVMTGDTVLGVLNIESPQVNFFDEGDKRLLAGVAAQFGVALSNLNAQCRLREQAVRDPLTQVFNRHYLNEVIDGELDRADRYNRDITLMMIDINGFSQVNNTLGHLKGDEVLQKVAQVLTESLRSSDRVIRYGGDEFLIFMPETIEEDGIVARRLKRKARALQSEPKLGNLKIGLSIGTYTRHPGDTHSVEEILSRADQFMYQDKRRNYFTKD
jgi:diguanylate cyclase (GGDEF)-like protein/PAS domain S-box-containing protein